MSLRPYVPQPEGDDSIWYPGSQAQQNATDSLAQMLLFGGSAGSLKALALDTPIPTPSGWTTMGQLRVGSEIFSDDGLVCTVLGLSPVFVDQPLYEVAFDDGATIQASGDHLWRTMTALERLRFLRQSPEWRAARRARRAKRGSGKKPWLADRNAERGGKDIALEIGAVRSTEEIAASLIDGTKRLNHSIAIAEPLELSDIILPIDPYVLGAWLGDGTSQNGAITCDDPPILEEIEKAGYPITKWAADYSYGIGGGLKTALRLNDILGNKHIPNQYLRASRLQRVALLQGLMDTDGSATRGRGCVFTNTNYRLIQGTHELLMGLGIKSAISSWTARCNGKDCGPCYGLSFVCEFDAFRLKRKLAVQVRRTRDTARRRYITSVREVTSKPTRCIVVDSPSHLYLCGRHFIPTHNTNFLINDAVRERDNPNMVSLFLRESYPQLQKNVLPEMRRYYSQMGAYFVEGVKRVWTFPSGARVHVGVIAREADIPNFQGNPFSALYADESGNHPEKHFRDILPWLRSTDPSLFKRVRFGSNPGGVGAAWQMHVFLANNCPVHAPKKSVQPGVIYGGKGHKPSTWHSDGKPIPLTVSFIPGKITDHNLLGDDYADLLQMQQGERAEQLLRGCWCRLEGAYFSFLRPEYVMPYALVGDEWWWTHFISIDYGYGSSAAAAGLYAVNDAGRIFKIGEIVERKMGSVDFARKIRDEWIRPSSETPYPNKGNERMRIVCCFMDPANDSKTGTGRSNMDLMAEVFAEDDVDVVPANKGRIANAQRLLDGLQNAKLVVTDLCPQTYKSLTTRMHSERDGDVKKIHGDLLDDLYDETSYAYNTWIAEATKPKGVAQAEKIAQYQKQGMDEHSLNVNRLRMLMDTDDEDAPVRITRVGQRHGFGGR